MKFIYKENQNEAEELYHHGVKGQEWGVKHGPPYPLDRATHNRVTGKSSGSIKTKGKPFSNHIKAFKNSLGSWDQDGWDYTIETFAPDDDWKSVALRDLLHRHYGKIEGFDKTKQYAKLFNPTGPEIKFSLENDIYPEQSYKNAINVKKNVKTIANNISVHLKSENPDISSEDLKRRSKIKSATTYSSNASILTNSNETFDIDLNTLKVNDMDNNKIKHSDNELYHYAIPGYKKGVRRFQYEDGSLTPEGKLRYQGGSTGSRFIYKPNTVDTKKFVETTNGSARQRNNSGKAVTVANGETLSDNVQATTASKIVSRYHSRKRNDSGKTATVSNSKQGRLVTEGHFITSKEEADELHKRIKQKQAAALAAHRSNGRVSIN